MNSIKPELAVNVKPLTMSKLLLTVFSSFDEVMIFFHFVMCFFGIIFLSMFYIDNYTILLCVSLAEKLYHFVMCFKKPILHEEEEL